MEKVTLFYLERPDITISIRLYFNEKNELFFDGYDIGKTVEEAWGDSDFEYTYTVGPEEVEKLYTILNVPSGDRAALLEQCKVHFSGNHAYTTFGDFLEKNNIIHEGFTWS